jgi:hypothetical protein
MPIIRATNKVAPPIKKSELVEALAIRKLEQMRKEQEELGAQIQTAERELFSQENLALILAQGKPTNYHGRTFEVSSSRNGDELDVRSVSATVEMGSVPAQIRRAFIKLKSLEKKRLFALPTIHDLKRSISAQISGQSSTERVAHLLKDEAMSKALDQTLGELDKRTQAALT